MMVSMFKFYKVCLFSYSNLALQFRLLLMAGVLLVIMTSSLDLVDKIVRFETSEPNRTLDFNTRWNRMELEKIDVSEIAPNCGIRYSCKEDEFPVHVYTGQDKDDEPKLCVGGKYVHGVGRGLNIAVIGSTRSNLKSLRNFDLYGQNSTGLESWLRHELEYDDIIVAFTFDEASKELSKDAKAILYLLGSGKIQDLQFRCQWYMISQKGIGGFTPLEEITYGKNFQWGKAIDKRLCVPKKIEPIMVSPDPYPRRNPLRERICQISTELADDIFCESPGVHEPFIPSQLTNRSLLGNPVFSTPILVVSGPSLATLALTLETLVYQPGIQTSLVFVVHTPKQIYVPYLAKIFSCKALCINSTFPLTTNDKIEYGLDYIANNFPQKLFAIVLEEGLILAWDFLFYMAQLITNLFRDNTILGISSWNPYGYVGVSGDAFIAYRAQYFPGLGFLMRMSTYKEHMQGRMHSCCSRKTFQGWNPLLENSTYNILVPDVSRVLRRPRDYYLREMTDEEFRIFTKPRITNMELNTWINSPQDMVLDSYIDKIQTMVNNSITIRLSEEDLKSCEISGTCSVIRLVKELRYKIVTLFYKETDSIRLPVLKAHLHCFNIYVPLHNPVYNVFKKVVRLFVNTNSLLLIESTSPFAKIT